MKDRLTQTVYFGYAELLVTGTIPPDIIQATSFVLKHHMLIIFLAHITWKPVKKMCVSAIGALALIDQLKCNCTKTLTI